MIELNVLLGKTVTSIERIEDGWDGEQLVFTIDTGERYRFYHSQECCEDVRIEDIVGDLSDLIGSPLTMAEVVTGGEELGKSPVQPGDNYTWTFYKLATVKGYVTIRWYGSSNGSYSEEVRFEKL